MSDTRCKFCGVREDATNQNAKCSAIAHNPETHVFVEAGHAEPSLFERSETETPTQGRIWADSEHVPQCDSLSVIRYCHCGWKVEWAVMQAPTIDAARKLAWSQFLLHLRMAQPSSQAGEPTYAELKSALESIGMCSSDEKSVALAVKVLHGYESSSQAQAGTALPAPLEFLQQKQWGEGTTPEHLAWLDKVAELSHEVEDHCPCGARPESIHTHPHVPGCPVEKLVKMVGDFRKLSDQATNHCVGLQKELDELKAAQAGTAGTPTATEVMLRNLLAVIHRDGGHYVAEHGLEKASMDAEALVLKARSEGAEAMRQKFKAVFSDLAVEMRKHSNDHLYDTEPITAAQAAVEGVCADRIESVLARALSLEMPDTEKKS